MTLYTGSSSVYHGQFFFFCFHVSMCIASQRLLGDLERSEVAMRGYIEAFKSCRAPVFVV